MKTSPLMPVLMIFVILVTSCDQDEPTRVAGFDGTIETFAGTVFGYEGDEGPAKHAKFGFITGLWIDAAGNLYVSDGAANTIRKINSSSKVTTVAGKFRGFNTIDPQPYSGDGSAATDAHLNVPLAVTTDAEGNIYLSDAGNNVLRKVSAADGAITTIAGNVTQGSTGDNGPASLALINLPNGMATDTNGNLYFADSQNHIIRKISSSGVITTLAGTPGEDGYIGDGGSALSAKLSAPAGIAIDKSGVIYFTDNNSVIRRIGTDGKITTIAGTGIEGYGGDGSKAIEAKLLAPKGIAVAPDGSVLVADAGNNRIRKISVETGIIETIAGTGETGYEGDGGLAVNAKLSSPQGLAIDSDGNIYVAESGNSVIRIIKPVN
jgi:sugar lactone lactonase YvrE